MNQTIKSTAKKITSVLIPSIVVLFVACSGGGSKNSQSTGLDNRGFPTEDGGAGSDVISTSTNMSDKQNETAPDLKPYSGAGYVAPAKINNYGAVSLGYQIDIPAGRAGMGPSVSIGYTSSGGDGLCGIGWSFSAGLGAISRTTQHGRVYYNQRDIFTFNGKRLLKVSGDKENENGIYRMEIESGFSKFVLSDIENGGVWTVYDKAGTVTTFGTERAHRIYHPDDNTKTYCWYFTRSLDLNGNYAYAIYDSSLYETNNVLYLKEIRYTGNINTGEEPRQFVRFNYTQRDDRYVSKAAGFVMTIDRLLSTIEVGWNDPDALFGGETTLWDYKLIYAISEDSNRPLLQTIESDRTTTQPKFTYGETNHTLRWQTVENNFSSDQELDPQATKYFEGDFNGDGISDMVFFNPQTGEWKAAQGNRLGGYTFPVYGNAYQGYDSEQKIQFFKGNVSGDYNGDGRSDIAFYLPETKMFVVAQHNGEVFEYVNYGRLTMDIDIFSCDWFPGDYDGNGLSDTVLFDEKSGQWILMRNMGGKFEFEIFSRKFQHIFRSDYSPNNNLDSVSTSDSSPQGLDRGKVHFFMGDYNGDGRSDISLYDSRNGKWWVGTPLNPPGGGTASLEIDWKLYKVFTAPEQALFAHTRFSGDFNGDGYSDFLFFDKETSEWTLGATKDNNITFTTYSRSPGFKDITRWLQGDFNGDGRTDIGFYSATDGNFWIGEATPAGFRYRIYSNMAYGPDSKNVMETPLPKSNITIGKATGFVHNSTSTTQLTWQYDTNYNIDRGERIFSGYFTDAASPQLLVFDRELNNIYYHNGTSQLDKDEDPFLHFDLDDNITVLNNEKPFENKGNAGKGLLFYKKNTKSHVFGFVGVEGTEPVNHSLADISTEHLSSFDLQTSMYVIDHFDPALYDAENQANASNDKDLLVLDTSGTVPHFKLVTGTVSAEGTPTELAIVYNGTALFDQSPADFQTLFTNYHRSTSLVHLFSSGFNPLLNGNQLLIADTRSDKHKWYVGIISSTAITFYPITTEQQFPAGTYNKQYHTIDANKLIIPTVGNGQARFHTLNVQYSDTEGWTIAIQSSKLAEDVTFRYEYDHKHNPILYKGTTLQILDLAENAFKDINFADTAYNQVSITRQDLLDNAYPFRWIQGDYNGDNKTDIGIFHLKERDWYFAVSTGTVPDLLTRVDNGIGGYYLYEYENSSGFDNTGEDTVPDLPMNYKVCSKQTIDDGFARRLVTKYEYKNGFARSRFINGYKEVDYFGFSTFTVIDALGSKSISTYHTTPYDDFRKNRALSGAIKENRFLGWDQKEYTRTAYNYKIHEIVSPPFGSAQGSVAADENIRSFLIEPVAVREYARNNKNEFVLTKTTRSSIVLKENEYAMESKVASVTDHYKDDVHAETTSATYSRYENIDSTNEMRLVEEKTFVDITDYETNAHNNTAYTIGTSYIYNDFGDISHKEVAYLGSGLASVETQVSDFEYDDYGNVIKTTNNSSTPARIKDTAYDDRLHMFVTGETVYGDSVNLTEVYEIDYGRAFGSITKKTDPNGNSSYFEYDSFGRLVDEYTDIDGSKQKINSYSYVTQPYMNVKLTRYSGNSDVPTELRVYVDGIGRTLHTVSSATAIPGKRYIKSGKIIYDPLGRVIRQSQPHWALDREIDTYEGQHDEKDPTRTEYDATGRVKKVTMPKTAGEERETSVTYVYNDPWEVIQTHSVGRTSRTIKNARGLVLYAENYGVGDDGTTVRTKIGFVYDATGKRIKKSDIETEGPLVPGQVIDNSMPSFDYTQGSAVFTRGAADNDVYWWYDGFGRVIASNGPDFGGSTVEYNAFGEVERSTDALGRITEMKYDRLGRLKEKVLPGTEGSVYYYYDSLSYSDNALGRMVAIDDANQRKEFSYDELGRVTDEKRIMKDAGVWTADGPYETHFTYDLLGRHREIRYPEDPGSGISAVVSYSYAPMGVDRVSVTSGSVNKILVSAVAYNEFGQMQTVQRGNGTTTEYTYDIKNRLKTLVTVDSQGQKIQDVNYTFKIDNSIAAIENRPEVGPDGFDASTISYNYIYDGLNRLVHAAGLYERSASGIDNQFERGYTYSSNGNMLSKTVFNPQTHAIGDQWTYTYVNHKVERITSSLVGGLKYEMFYDAVGNMREQRDHENNYAKSMEFSSSNRITQVMDPDTGELVGKYFYDDQGFRVRKVARRFRENQWRHVELVNPSMYFGVEKQWTVEGQTIPDTQYAVNNIYVNGVRFASLTPDGEARYYLTDQVDSVKVVVNDTGTPVSSFEYLPYGETWFRHGDTKNNPQYNSQALDTETGFYFYNTRHYDPEICRFVTADSVVDGELMPVGWNGYAYVGGNPVVYKDPSGNNSLDGYDYADDLSDDEVTSVRNKQEVSAFQAQIARSVRSTVLKDSIERNKRIVESIIKESKRREQILRKGGTYAYVKPVIMKVETADGTFVNAVPQLTVVGRNQERWRFHQDVRAMKDVVDTAGGFVCDLAVGLGIESFLTRPLYGGVNYVRRMRQASKAGGLSDDILRLSEANINNSGKTVLGQYKGVKIDYIKKAQNMNASYYDIGNNWYLLTDSQRWAANQHFLDVISAKKQSIFLNVAKQKIKTGTWLHKEIEYLTRHKGYKWVNQWKLIPPR